jgi:DNA-binding response OmpR family regulator
MGALAGREILVIEDEPVVTLDLAKALQDAGAEVICTDCVRGAILAERPFLSGAIMDCVPTSRDRWSIIRRLRERDVPLVLYRTVPPATNTPNLSAPFVAKTASPAQVVRVISSLIRRNGAGF